MKRLMILTLAFAFAGCSDFVDEDGNTSIRQFAEGMQSLGDRVAELGEAIERDADIEAVPWERLMETVPQKVGRANLLERDGDDARDRNGAGLSMATGRYEVQGDSMFVGVADLGALRSGARLALRWVAPLFDRGEIDGDIEELEVEGYPAIRIRDEDDGDLLVAVLVEGRFAVVAGGPGTAGDDFVWEALEEVDYRQLRRWVDYGEN